PGSAAPGAGAARSPRSPQRTGHTPSTCPRNVKSLDCSRAVIIGKISRIARFEKWMEHAALLTAGEPAWDRRRAVTLPERSFSEAVREHEALLTAIARRLCGNDADAADLVHDTYERALRAWDRYSDRGNLRSWMVAILNNLFIDRCRKHRRTPRTEAIDGLELAAPEPGAAPAWAGITAQQIDAALATLGPEFRRVSQLHARAPSP